MQKTPLTRELMAARVAAEFQDGWIVNLGIGMPTYCSDYIAQDQRIILHSENGLIGYGRRANGDEADPHVVNAGVLPVMLEPYTAIVDQAESFALVRSGRLDVGVLGAYEAAANSDFANWKVAGRLAGSMGGAMDIAACAQRIFLMLEHTTREGVPRLVRRCALPVTAVGVVKLIVTDLGVFEPLGDSFKLKEIAPGYSVADVQAVTGAPLITDGSLREVQI